VSAPLSWKRSLKLFFSERARHIEGVPTPEELCFVSGRDPRLWLQTELFEDLVETLIEKLRATPDSVVLEVGCASGFLARGLAPRVRRYVGVDVSESAVEVARRLLLSNAEFQLAEGNNMRFDDSTFDGAVCCDVFTNFPDFANGIPVIREMLRVVKPGGRCLIGSVPDKARQADYPARIAAVTAELDTRLGTTKVPEQGLRPGMLRRAARLLRLAEPGIVCYYFCKDDFVALGERLGVTTLVSDVHGLNPYLGYRFDVVYTKPA
jgi:SAM-dependent methyltransferase